jgi:hypothetical protein
LGLPEAVERFGELCADECLERLPEALRRHVSEQNASGQCGKTSEHLRKLAQRDQEQHTEQGFLELIEASLSSGPAQAIRPFRIARLNKRSPYASTGCDRHYNGHMLN